MRELRREYDLFRLEAALGFDSDLIKRRGARSPDYSASPTAASASARSKYASIRWILPPWSVNT